MAARPALPPTGLDRRTLGEEIAVVLSLSLLASVVYAVISLLEAPLAGVTTFAVSQSTSVARQVTGLVFGLAPVWLVVHLARRDGGVAEILGLDLAARSRDVRNGALLFAAMGSGGAALYLAAVELGVNRFVVPAPPAGYWWTVPILLLASARAAFLEEIVAVGYLVTRLGQRGWSPRRVVAASAVLRAAYHLYQGWGGFLGNLVLGVVFAGWFARTRRTWPLVVAHLLLDVAAGGIYLAFRDRLPGF